MVRLSLREPPARTSLCRLGLVSVEHCVTFIGAQGHSPVTEMGVIHDGWWLWFESGRRVRVSEGGTILDWADPLPYP